MSDSAAAYVARQTVTVGRSGGPRRRVGLPCLPGASDADRPAPTRRDDDPGRQAPQAVAIHPQGRLLLTGGSDGAVRCWNLATGLPLWEGSERHAARIHDIAVSPSGQRLATASYDQTLRFWSTRDGHCLHRYERHHSLSYQLKWSITGSVGRRLRR